MGGLKKPWFWLGLLFIYSVSVDVLPILKGIFPLTFDQGRDFIWVENQFLKGQPSLVGPWGSIAGTFFGPLWFWLLSLPFLISQGSPVVMTLFNTVIIYLSVFLGSGLLFFHQRRLGWLVLGLGLLSPGLHSIANFAFSQHLLPLFTISLIYCTTRLLAKPRPGWLYGAVLAVALMFHAEPPLTIFSLPFLIGIIYWSQKRHQWLTWKTGAIAMLLFTVPFWPLLLFDWRHDFIQARGFLAYFFGQEQGFKPIASLNFWTRLIDRPVKLLLTYQRSLINLPVWLFLPLGAAIAYFNQRYLRGLMRWLWLTSLLYVISLWVGFVIFPEDLKMFYLSGLMMIFIWWAALALNLLVHKRQLTVKTMILSGIILLIINLNPWKFFLSAKANFSDRQSNESLYVNQLQAIDWVYASAGGQGFKVYVFTPPIYDFAWQYLFFYYGLKHYGYLPAEFAYLPQVPDYVPLKNERLAAAGAEIRPAEKLFYLVVTTSYPNRISGWRANFAKLDLELMDQIQLADKTKIEKYFLK